MFEFITHTLQEYPDAMLEQEARVQAILHHQKDPCLIFSQHPACYTLGTSGHMDDVLKTEPCGQSIPVYKTGRGGEVTYHGPGQLMVYVLADLRKKQDLHQHIWNLEELIIQSLQHFSIQAQRNSRGIGVWVGDNKIAAVGVRCRRWVTWHGVALNISPDLSHYQGIVACGMQDNPVTSMEKQGLTVQRETLEKVLQQHCLSLFS
ncbi:MAG: lipoyl(octanoyl) transferase LipB [Mariprofundaceae bacterium]|nr:lipoyl(octanoyl) transferase LipB [Mariprofundaceae bacterium]